MRPHFAAFFAVTALGALGALGAGGCLESYDPASYLEKPRFLAIVADPPEVASGETSTLHVLHFPDDTATFDWAYCTHIPPLGSTDSIARECLESDTADFLVPLPSGDTTQIKMPDETFTSLGLPDGTGGFYLPIRVRMKTTASDGTPVTSTGVYRLRWHPPIPTAPNKNPALMGLYLVPSNGSSPPDAGATGTKPFEADTAVYMAKGDKITLRALVTPDSAETYKTIDDAVAMTTKDATETLTVSWFADAGSWSHDATGPEQPDTEFTLDDKHLPTTDKIHLYLILRDERGGTSYLTRTINFQQ